MLLGELLFDRTVERAGEHIRQPGERLACLLRRHRPRQDARSDQEHLFLCEYADAIEKVLVRTCLLKRAVETVRNFGFFRQRAEEAWIDHGIHHLWKLREAVCQPWRGAEDERDQRDEIRILPQQREQPAAAMKPGEEAVESDDGRVRVRRTRELVEEHGHDLSELAARELAFQRPVRTGAPATHEG